jgi:hypothetical protein
MQPVRTCKQTRIQSAVFPSLSGLCTPQLPAACRCKLSPACLPAERQLLLDGAHEMGWTGWDGWPGCHCDGFEGVRCTEARTIYQVWVAAPFHTIELIAPRACQVPSQWVIRSYSAWQRLLAVQVVHDSCLCCIHSSVTQWAANGSHCAGGYVSRTCRAACRFPGRRSRASNGCEWAQPARLGLQASALRTAAS